MTNPLRWVAKRAFDESLNTDGPSHTFMRLCTSRHVDDLQLVATVALVAILGLIAVVLFEGIAHPTAFKDQIAIYTAVLAAAGGIVSWAYQSGNRRLGAVDLFASEISAICRVCLIVDFAETSVVRAHEAAGSAPAPAPAAGDAKPNGQAFTSQEQYTPVYDKNIADLQSLDFDVVKNVTCFYTYRKTMMDLMRRIAVTAPPNERFETYKQMIYMQYLMYESGRLALKALVEFEPDQSECIINTLCSEFVLYAFLKREYQSEFRSKRLDLRLAKYHQLVAKIRRNTQKNRHKAWEKARTTEPELVTRYEAMCAALGTAV